MKQIETKLYTFLYFKIISFKMKLRGNCNFINFCRCDLIVGEKCDQISRRELISKISGVDGLYCLLSDKIDEEILSAAGPQLKVVATMSVGVNHLDLKALKKRNIYVGYTPGILTNATAELTIGLLLATSRRLIEAHKAIFK